MLGEAYVDEDFARFAGEVESKLRRALVGAYGPEVGLESARDAMAYAWENWSQVSKLNNPIGYLYRVGQSRSRRYLRPAVVFPAIRSNDLPDVDPRLPSALKRLSYQQRASVVLLYVEELSEREAAEALGISRATLRKHAERGMTKLRAFLRVDPE